MALEEFGGHEYRTAGELDRSLRSRRLSGEKISENDSELRLFNKLWEVVLEKERRLKKLFAENEISRGDSSDQGEIWFDPPNR